MTRNDRVTVAGWIGCAESNKPCGERNSFSGGCKSQSINLEESEDA
jgi:hypothetical protein